MAHLEFLLCLETSREMQSSKFSDTSSGVQLNFFLLFLFGWASVT